MKFNFLMPASNIMYHQVQYLKILNADYHSVYEFSE